MVVFILGVPFALLGLVMVFLIKNISIKKPKEEEQKESEKENKEEEKAPAEV